MIVSRGQRLFPVLSVRMHEPVVQRLISTDQGFLVHHGLVIENADCLALDKSQRENSIVHVISKRV